MIQALAPGISVAAARRVMAQAFRAHGFDAADLDARLLLGHALQLDHAALISDGERRLSQEEAAAAAALAARRLAHEPVARILGRKEFWGLEFRISPATLVPRPETETVVEAVLAVLDRDGLRNRALRIADFGTGSGALLLALLSELPNATGIGTDVSLPALATAGRNAKRLGLAGRSRFVACDFGAALRAPFDVIVSNPPYVATGDIPTLAPEVREHDSHLALDGGPSGLDCYPAIVADARHLLADGGLLAVEVGAGRATAVSALLADGGIMAVSAKADLGGHFRAVLGRAAHARTASEKPKIALGLSIKSD